MAAVAALIRTLWFSRDSCSTFAPYFLDPGFGNMPFVQHFADIRVEPEDRDAS